MPRRNCNADYHRTKDNFSRVVFFEETPPAAGPASGSESTPSGVEPPPGWNPARREGPLARRARKPTGLKIDAETIVREYRRNWQDQETRRLEDAGKILPIIPSPPHRVRLWHYVNWDIALTYIAWSLCVAALAMIMGLLVFGPTNWRDFLWR